MKRKYTVIIMAVLIMALIVTFSMIGCKKATVVTPATTVETPTETTAAPETTAPEETTAPDDLAAAIEAANTELAKVADAETAYITAGGLEADAVYTDVTTAETAVGEALAAAPQVTVDILSTTATLTEKLEALDAATAPETTS
jgi:hypothetical protein